MKRFRFRAKRKEAFSFLGRASLDWSETREESWLSPVVVLETRGVHTESCASPRRDERTTRRRGTTPNILPSACAFPARTGSPALTPDASPENTAEGRYARRRSARGARASRLRARARASSPGPARTSPFASASPRGRRRRPRGWRGRRRLDHARRVRRGRRAFGRGEPAFVLEPVVRFGRLGRLARRRARRTGRRGEPRAGVGLAAGRGAPRARPASAPRHRKRRPEDVLRRGHRDHAGGRPETRRRRGLGHRQAGPRGEGSP